MIRTSCLLLLTAFPMFGCAGPAARIVRPTAIAYSAPVPVNEVQDCAFWIHPTTPEKCLLLVTNEHRGLEVHDLNGVLLKHLDEGCQPQYVDVIYDVPVAGRKVDLAVASCTAEPEPGVRFWEIDREKGKLLESKSIVKVFGGSAPLGLFTFHSKSSGKCYFFVTRDEGLVEQHEITAAGDGTIGSALVRSFKLAGKSKGGVADADAGVVYFACDKTGIWRFSAEPDQTTEGRLVIKAGENGLVPNVRGPALYRGFDGTGYLLVAGQGSKGGHSVVSVYERGGENRFVLTIDPACTGPGPIDHSSGLDVTSSPTTAFFPAGVLAVNDQVTPTGNEDFKLYSWKDIAAAGGLKIDTAVSPRR